MRSLPPDNALTQWCLKYAGIAQFRYEFAGRIRLANAGTERLARSGTHVRQSVGDEPHPAETEAATDDPLLVKTPSGMMPTDRALALIDPVKAVLRDIRRLISAREEFDPAKSVRRFVIAATDYMDLLVIPALVERIARYAPGVDIHVKQTETPFPVRELEYNDLDVVLGFETILKPPGHLVVEKLFDDRMTCIVSRNHPINRAELPTLDEYVSMKHMLISRTGTRIGLIDDWLTEKGLSAASPSSCRTSSAPWWWPMGISCCPCQTESPSNSFSWPPSAYCPSRLIFRPMIWSWSGTHCVRTIPPIAGCERQILAVRQLLG